jgi:hypothetical protein
MSGTKALLDALDAALKTAKEMAKEHAGKLKTGSYRSVRGAQRSAASIASGLVAICNIWDSLKEELESQPTLPSGNGHR